MSIFKCKIRGGTIEFEQGTTVGGCDSCGTKQTLPQLDNDKQIVMTAPTLSAEETDHDRAVRIYEQILADDSTDAEAYWSLVLCRYRSNMWKILLR